MKVLPVNFIARKNARLVKPIFLYELQYNKTSNLWLRYAAWPVNVTFDGFTYAKATIAHDGIAENSNGSAPRVKLSVGNADRVIQYYTENYNGLRDMQVNILQVFQETLTDPTVVDRVALYVLDVSVTSQYADFELSTKYDVFDITLPRRKFYRGYCSHLFKDAGCAYSGVEVSCNKTMQRCIELNNIHRFGAFPAIPQKNVFKLNVS